MHPVIEAINTRRSIRSSVIGAAFVPDAYADSAFAEKYRAYQAEVRAGKEAFDKKNYQAAIEHYSKAIEQSPFEATHYSNRGIARYKTGNYKEAIGDFDKMLVLDSRMVQSDGMSVFFTIKIL